MYDIIIIGSGPSGYTAALESIKLNKRVLLIEKDEIGGVCLNRGCIPTKSLLNSGKLYKKSKNASNLGIDISNICFNFQNAISWKDQAVLELKNSLENRMKQKGIHIIKGTATLKSKNEVIVGDSLYKTEYILLATGAIPIIPNIKGIDSKSVLTSNQILTLKEKPKSITIIGGGFIGVEFASFFNSIDVDVHLIELKNRVLPTMETRIGKLMVKALEIDIHLNSEVNKIEENIVYYLEDGVEKSITSNIILLAVGRRANIDSFTSLGLESKGFIEVDNNMKTNIDNIYAVGDCTGKTFLAHGGSKMAEIAIRNIFSSTKMFMDYNLIPSVVYSEPEAASVGLTSNEAKKLNLSIIKNTIFLKNNGRYYVEDGYEKGICIVIVNRETKVILGVHILGSGVSEIIGIATMAIQEGFTLVKFSEFIFPHPTLSETIKDNIFFNS